jgi:hypothetical protein
MCYDMSRESESSPPEKIIYPVPVISSQLPSNPRHALAVVEIAVPHLM